jgi:hypothetical protein
MHQPKVARNRRWHSFDATLQEVLYVGKEVALPHGNTRRSISATIVDIDENGRPNVALYGEMASSSAEIHHTVNPEWLLQHMLPMKGGRVQWAMRKETFFGTITRVRPDGVLDVNFDNGVVQMGLSPNKYILVPNKLRRPSQH